MTAKHFVLQGLPDKTFLDTLYSFTLTDNNCVSVPGYYIGRDADGYPDFPEQLDWLNKFCKSTGNEPYFNAHWELKKEGSRDKLIKILEAHHGVKGVYSNIDFHRNDAIRYQGLITIAEIDFSKIKEVTIKEEYFDLNAVKTSEDNGTVLITEVVYNKGKNILQLYYKENSVAAKFFYSIDLLSGYFQKLNEPISL